ncbi:zinc finger CCCH domain-containing protein 13-like isoform X1 [Ornithodoros turicata]|uniref:zinc finger CCCH domain-containing protein 13-like isoform X1 n=1 Tax=Ornithodoros turicata TaxID=34597 RepID=UPI003139D0E8
MSSKIQRKVTVENVKDSTDAPRRPSVFERLGPGAVSTQERHSRSSDPGEKCRNWMRSGICSYGSKCRYQHEAYPPSSSTSSKTQKAEREPSQKDLRHKVRHKQQDVRESRSRSPSPKKRKLSSGGGSNSRTRRLDNESKIKSTVVVTRPRTPSSEEEEVRPAKETKPPKNWEGASDDWPLDEASLDYKEELSLEMKRQQLQRELEMLQKENRPSVGAGASSSSIPASGHVTITKTVRATHTHQAPASFSGSSESSSDSDSSSSDSSSSSSDDDSDDSSSSSSSGEASPVAVRSGSNAAAPPSPSDHGRYRHRGGGDERPAGRRGVPEPPPPAASFSRGRDAPRSGTSHSRAEHRDVPRHGRERQAAGREGGEGRSPLPRRRQDPEYDSYARSRGPRTPSPGAVSDAKRKLSVSKQPVQVVQPKVRKKKKSSKRRRERERQLKAQHRSSTRTTGQSEPSGRDSVSPDLLPPVSSSRGSRHGARDAPRRSREREAVGRSQGAGDAPRHGPPRGRSPALLPAHESMTPPHLHRSTSDKYGAPPSKRPRRDSPSLVDPPPREPRKKESERHGREEHGSHPKGSYEPRYSGESEGRGHQGSRKRDDGYAEPPPPPHRHRHETVEDDTLEPGEVMPEQGDRYGGDRGCHEGGRSRDSRRSDYHHSRSTSPSMGSISRSRIDVDMHRMSEYPHSPQGGRSRGPDLSKGKGDQRSSDMRRDPYPHPPPDGRGDSYRRVDSRSDPHKGDPRPDGRPDYHERGGSRSDYHGRMDPKSDYHRGDPYGKGGDGRPEREPRGDPYSRGDMRGDSYRSSDYRHDRGDHRMDMRCKEPPRMERDLPYEPRQEGYGRGDDYYGRPPDPKMDRGRDYYGDGYGGHRSEPRDRGSRDGRRPEHLSRSEPHPKGGMRMERDRRGGDTRGGERSRGESDSRADGRPDSRPSAYGSKSDHMDSRGRGDSRGEDVRDPYERGDGYRGDRPEPHRVSDLRGDSGRRDHKRPSRLDPASEESSSSRYGRRDEDGRERESRVVNRDSRGGVCSRSSSPARSYERKRTAHKDRIVRENTKREDDVSAREVDVKDDRSSNGSRGSSPGRPQEKTAARSSREAVSERREQSPDTSIPEVVAPKVDAASPLTEDSEEESPAKGEVSDSSKHMVLVEECKSDDENDNVQEQKAAASETFSDWSDDEDDILTRDDPTLEFVTKEPSSDSHNDQVSQDKLEEAAEANLIEVDAVPISPADSHHSGEGGLGTAEEFDPISDDELEALIDESKDKALDEEKTTISDVLDIDWSSLVKDARPKDESATKRSSARERYSAARVFARIGISKDLAGEELTQQVVEFCRKELGGDSSSDNAEPEFQLEDLTAGFHVAAVAARKQQTQALQCCGHYSRALSARRDLMLRRALCKVYEPSTTTAATAVDPELYKRSLQLFQSRVTMEVS